MKLAGKVAVVTGASRGIGKSIAIELAKQGADVVVNYAGSVDRANEVVKEIESLGRKAMSVQCDVSDSDAVNAMMKEALEAFGNIDILVNNAYERFRMG